LELLARQPTDSAIMGDVGESPDDSIESLMMSLMNDEDDADLRDTLTDFIDSAPKQKTQRADSRKNQLQLPKGNKSFCQCKAVQWIPGIEGGGWKRKRKGPAVSRGGMSPQEIAEYTKMQAAQGPISTFDLLFAMRWHKRRLMERMVRQWRAEAKHRRAHDAGNRSGNSLMNFPDNGSATDHAPTFMRSASSTSSEETKLTTPPEALLPLPTMTRVSAEGEASPARMVDTFPPSPSHLNVGVGVSERKPHRPMQRRLGNQTISPRKQRAAAEQIDNCAPTPSIRDVPPHFA
jgi:hypothetical protein